MRKNHLEIKKILANKSKIWLIVKVANGRNLLFTLFSVTMGEKYVKFGSKACQKLPICYESLRKIPLWADFSKTAQQRFLKLPVLETSGHPLLNIKIKKYLFSV
jgi:hypothetical protein